MFLEAMGIGEGAGVITGDVSADGMVSGEAIANTIAIFGDGGKAGADPWMIDVGIFVDLIGQGWGLTRGEKPLLGDVVIEEGTRGACATWEHVQREEVSIHTLSDHALAISVAMGFAGLPKEGKSLFVLKAANADYFGRGSLGELTFEFSSSMDLTKAHESLETDLKVSVREFA